MTARSPNWDGDIGEWMDVQRYVFSTFGQKVRWMRANPQVCVQTDQIENQGEWISVIVNGQYEELPEPQLRSRA